ncbi:GNAT family N-acetyltransferase [Starkeya sp. ORNL1]|uniref:GNAT family N-acetyltransferase n=1 Tax=Starkeya sp. ORNL1 TaxID=2709380 RepID=UPI0014629E2C|nr:GNAT family N-acetyltransferase [Starkeya sp. ORNL1]QJP16938.1 GNAT family N-acetyltransferase [Starkeya sp. ORNL1]
MLLVRHAKTPDDFVTVHSLLAEMGAWDAETVALLGLSSDDVIPTYYAEDPEALRVCFTSGEAALLLCTDDGVAIGCGGFVGDGRVAEITKIYVRPEARGRGAGRTIMSAMMREIEGKGFHRARLITTEFMVEAQAMYAAFGFQRCANFEPAPASLQPITVYMERTLVREG